ncbi:hypothetical protein KVF89_11025 [Nocardioides carbamazepini]|nr:hypothetical protein [Nocardioides carbamazepini]MCR1783068.1 hypothetical protein [Nocardioides carbamazepini]
MTARHDEPLLSSDRRVSAPTPSTDLVEQPGYADTWFDLDNKSIGRA